MYARIKPHAVVWTPQNPAVWGGDDFVRGWRHMAAPQRAQYKEELASKVFEVRTLAKRRRCTLASDGFGSPTNYGRGPLMVHYDDLVFLRKE